MKKLHNVAEVDAEALERGPVRLAFLAPEDTNFMQAVKTACQRNLITPVLIGNKALMQKTAAEIDFEISAQEQVFLDDPRLVAEKGVEMLVSGEVDAISKGQMSTNYVYRAVIRQTKKTGGTQIIAVTSFWEITPLDHFVILTDPGVIIAPDRETKVELAKNAITYLKLYGHDDPRILLFSARRELPRELDSFTDLAYVQDSLAAAGIRCTVQSGNFMDLFTAAPGERPNIIVMPHLVTGNSIVKLDFFLDVKRRGVVMTTWGPVLIPSRADSTIHLADEISLAVVAASRFKEGHHEQFS